MNIISMSNGSTVQINTSDPFFDGNEILFSGFEYTPDHLNIVLKFYLKEFKAEIVVDQFDGITYETVCEDYDGVGFETNVDIHDSDGNAVNYMRLLWLMTVMKTLMSNHIIFKEEKAKL